MSLAMSQAGDLDGATELMLALLLDTNHNGASGNATVDSSGSRGRDPSGGGGPSQPTPKPPTQEIGALARELLTEALRVGRCDLMGRTFVAMRDTNTTEMGDAVVYARCAVANGHTRELIALLGEYAASPAPPRSRSEAVEFRSQRALLYSLAILNDAAGEWDAAWGHATAANALTARAFASIDPPDGGAARHLQALDDALAGFGERGPLPAAASSCQPHGFRLVVIMGFPRAGTSLLDQIMAAHPQVHSVGESSPLIFAKGLLEKLAGEQSLELREYLAQMDQPTINAVAADVTGRLAASMPEGTKVYISKVNFDALIAWLVPTLFPQCGRIIFCERGRGDLAVSNFMNNFNLFSHLAFAVDLGSTEAAIDAYARLTQHWRTVFDPATTPTLTVKYEALVSELEVTVREVLGFAGLPWHDGCLRFHDLDRWQAVSTNSVLQVHRPLYSNSLGRWVHYQQHMPPSLTAPAGDGSEAEVGVDGVRVASLEGR